MTSVPITFGIGLFTRESGHTKTRAAEEPRSHGVIVEGIETSAATHSRQLKRDALIALPRIQLGSWSYQGFPILPPFRCLALLLVMESGWHNAWNWFCLSWFGLAGSRLLRSLELHSGRGHKFTSTRSEAACVGGRDPPAQCHVDVHLPV